MIEVRQIRIKTAVEEDLSRGNLEVALCVDVGQEAFLCAQLLDREGREADRIFPLPLEAQMDFCMQVLAPQLWDAERVYLYDLVLELRDKKMRLLGSSVKKIAFRRWQGQGRAWMLNGRRPVLRARYIEDSWECLSEEALRAQLAKMKQNWQNTLVVKDGCGHPQLAELALEYGVYVFGEAEQKDLPLWECGASNPDFDLELTQDGVLIENHCLYTNAAEYELRYSLRYQDRVVCEGALEADVPPQTGRYVQIPYDRPKEAGEYRYEAALCLQRDLPWAKKGQAVATARAVISNMFFQ